MTISYEQDLRDRWRPSEEQVALADALLAAGYAEEREGNWGKERGVYTAHLLEGKEYGIWGDGIRVVHLDGVFLTRGAVLTFVKEVTRIRHEEGGQPVVGGYTWHMRPGEWAVWEDICSQFPAGGAR